MLLVVAIAARFALVRGIVRRSIPGRRRSLPKKYVAQLQYHVFVNGTRMSLSAYSQFS
jgi:hypothetical protein